MPGGVIGTSLNLGYLGGVSRNSGAVDIYARQVKSILSGTTETQEVLKFGDPVVLNTDNTVSLWGETGTGVSDPTAANFAGIAVREVKQATDYYTANGEYVPGEMADVCRLGNVTVKCNVGTPTAGGAVYIRKKANDAIPAGLVGGYEADADGTNSILIPNLKWRTGLMDANRTTEVTVNYAVMP